MAGPLTVRASLAPIEAREDDRAGGVCWAPLERTEPLALYRQIAERLWQAIFAGERRLPTERELARRFAVARVTVRAALDLLVARDLIARRRRHGTVVRDDFDPEAAPRRLGPSATFGPAPQLQCRLST
jgi:DNA-binding FadR family transcriptional regulator